MFVVIHGCTLYIVVSERAARSCDRYAIVWRVEKRTARTPRNAKHDER